MSDQGFFDEVNTQRCSRCGGSGHMPFAVWQGRCFKCSGDGRVPMKPKGQTPTRVRKAGPSADINDAVIGDIIMYYGTAARVLGVAWVRPKGSKLGNQRLIVERLVDGKISITVDRTVYYMPETPRAWTITYNGDGTETRTPCREMIPVSRAMQAKPALKDDDGNWIVTADEPVEANA